MHYYLRQRKENGIWEICWTESGGKPGHRSTGTRDRTKADVKLAEHILSAKDKAEMGGATVLQVVTRYWYVHGKSCASTDTVKRVIGLLADLEPATPLYGFSITKQREFIKRAGVAENTGRRYLGVIGAAVNHLLQLEELNRPLPIAKLSSHDKPGAKPFDEHQLRRLFAAATLEHEQRFLALCLSGNRPGHVLDFTWDRLQPSTGVADFCNPNVAPTKKRRSVVRLAPSVAAYLEARRGEGVVVQYADGELATFKMTFNRLADRAGVPRTAYSIRKALATWMRGEGVPEMEIKTVLGHASGVTDRYAHQRPEYMVASSASIERLVRRIAVPWLTSTSPVAAKPVLNKGTNVVDFATASRGGRDRDRTCDPYHVKGAIGDISQGLTESEMDYGNPRRS